MQRELVVIVRLAILTYADEITQIFASMDCPNAITILQEINRLTMRGIQNLPPIHRGIVGLNNMKFEQDAKIRQPPNIFERILNFLKREKTFVNDPVETILQHLVSLQQLEQEQENAHAK